MCFFKKKKQQPKAVINSKFKMGDFVSFHYRGELMFGYIYEIYATDDGKVLYDVQIGGQCPAVLYKLEEETLRLKTK